MDWLTQNWDLILLFLFMSPFLAWGLVNWVGTVCLLLWEVPQLLLAGLRELRQAFRGR